MLCCDFLSLLWVVDEDRGQGRGKGREQGIEGRWKGEMSKTERRRMEGERELCARKRRKGRKFSDVLVRVCTLHRVCIYNLNAHACLHRT